MLVKNCEGCPFFKIKRKTVRYEPQNYHAVGFSYRIGWCDLSRNLVRHTTKKDCIK